MDKIPLVVGNEIAGGNLYTVTLKEYLENFRLYMHNPPSWKGSQTSLWAQQRDSHVIMSSQACFLPVPQGGEAKFNVSIYNYQSSKNHPAVLAIVATAYVHPFNNNPLFFAHCRCVLLRVLTLCSFICSQGTSAQVVEGEGYRGQKLYFNKNGQRASFIGERLSDNRRQRGVAVEGEMTREEKQQNMIMIIQVPLKQTRPTRFTFDECDMLCAPPFAKSCFMPAGGVSLQRCQERADVEDAIIRVGEGEGEFNEVGGLEIARDPDFPVRVTLQVRASTNNPCSQQFTDKQTFSFFLYIYITVLQINCKWSD